MRRTAILISIFTALTLVACRGESPQPKTTPSQVAGSATPVPASDSGADY